MSGSTYDVVIIGGGVIGSAVAYNLMLLEPKLKPAVFERDPTYTRASSTLGLANIRVQFSLAQNIRISQYAMEFLGRFAEEMTVRDIRPNVYFRKEGNLFLVDESGRKPAFLALALQQELGCRVDWWTPDRIRERYPLYDPAGLEGGTFGADDGHIDPYAMLMGYRAKARSMGADYIKGEVKQILVDGKRVTGIETDSGSRVATGVVVNCAGAWASEITATVGIRLPVVPVKRQVFVLDTAVKPESPLPLTVLPSGLYFRSEGKGAIVLGKSMPEDPVGYDFTWDDKRFMDILWPELAAFVPKFDRLKLMRGWAGLYAVNTLDGNAILGEWPELKGFFLANGFSGHGLQQAPGVGRYLAEKILGKTPALDLSIFDPVRILENRPVDEKGLV